MKKVLAAGILALAALALAPPALEAKERKDVPEKYTWKLSDLYASKEAWKADKDRIAARLDELGAFKGKLGESPGTLYGALSTLMDLKKEAMRLNIYAFMVRDQDTRVSENQAMAQEGEKLLSDLAAASAFMDPEIQALEESKVLSSVASDARLKPYRPYLENIFRLKAHTRSPEVEKVLAQGRTLAGAPETIYSVFTGAELPYPEVTLSSGEKVRVDQSAYSKYRASTNREDRDRVFKAFWTTYDGYRSTMGAALGGHVAGHLLNRDVRGYGSCLEASLDENAIPTTVYTQLISDVHDNLPTLHRYLKLRQRMMGLEKLRYEDLYAPIVKAVDITFTPEQAMDLTLKAFEPLGKDYVETIRKGYESRWVDWYPSDGKRSGAYSEGAAYDVHPYQLLNFNGRYVDVSTLAHESGHSMHYFLSNKNQPYVTSEHAIFVAEVASTLNENLLFRHMMANTQDDDTRLFLLGSRLDGFRQTLFRQTLFAEFELRIHEMAEAGQPITGDALNKLYLDLVRQYYGHEAGVCAVDELYGAEWMFIHHFYYNFYVYQYATCLTASTYIADAMRAEGAAKPPSAKTRDAYLKLLSSGCSRYPIDLLKDVGADMTTSAPFKAAMKEMNEIMDRMEAILAKKK